MSRKTLLILSESVLEPLLRAFKLSKVKKKKVLKLPSKRNNGVWILVFTTTLIYTYTYIYNYMY